MLESLASGAIESVELRKLFHREIRQMRAGLVAPAAAGFALKRQHLLLEDLVAGTAGGWRLLALVAVQDIQLARVVGRLEAVVCSDLPRVGCVVDRVVDDENGVEVLRSAIGFERAFKVILNCGIAVTN